MLEITFYADFVCPFCYVAESALLPRLAAHWPEPMSIRWQGFELHPDTPASGRRLPKQDAGRIWGGYKRLISDWDLPVAKKPPPAIPNTRLALQLAEQARAAGRLNAYREAVYHAFWAEARDISDPAVLGALAQVSGFAPTDRIAHAQRQLIDARTEAHATGVSAVPAFRIGERVLHGLQDDEMLERFFAAK